MSGMAATAAMAREEATGHLPSPASQPFRCCAAGPVGGGRGDEGAPLAPDPGRGGSRWKMAVDGSREAQAARAEPEAQGNARRTASVGWQPKRGRWFVKTAV